MRNDVRATNGLSSWLAYSINPRQLRTALRPAMWGNGQLELMADLDRPCVGMAVCFGLGAEGLVYEGEQHLLAAVYDEAGRKYPLQAPHSTSMPPRATVTFRPDRQTWRYRFDDLTVDVSLILPRVMPGYLFKLELSPSDRSRSQKWRIYHQLRGNQGNLLWATDAGFSLVGGTAWCRSRNGNQGEAIGATADARAINLGLDYEYANDIMVEINAETGKGDRSSTIYFARTFGSTIDEARDGLARLLSSPVKLEAETEDWWNQYLGEVPRLESPDESLSKNFLWSWANFRMSRIELPIGKVPAGLFTVNNVRFSSRVSVSAGDPLEAEAIQLLHDPRPARDTMLFLLRETRQQGLLSPGYLDGVEFPGNYVCCLGWFCGLLHKYLLTTGDVGLLGEQVDGITFLERLEDALEAQLAFRDATTGLFWTDGEVKRSAGLYPGEIGGMGPSMEAVTRYRGAAGSFYSDSSAVIHGTFLALGDIEELARNPERSARYRQMAEDLRRAVQAHLWDEELGFFIDRRPDGSVSDYRGIGGFITGLFANHVYRPGGLASEEQARRLAEWCNHPDFVSELGVLCLARTSPYFDPADFKGFNSGFDMHWCNQVAAGLYAHGQHEEAHRQLFKLFRRLGENAGLGSRYRGEAYNADTGEILPWRFVNYPCILSAMSSVIEGVFGIRWTNNALTAQVSSPWPWVRLFNLRIRNSLLELESTSEGDLAARINGREVARSRERRLELPWNLFA